MFHHLKRLLFTLFCFYVEVSFVPECVILGYHCPDLRGFVAIYLNQADIFLQQAAGTKKIKGTDKKTTATKKK